PGVDRAARGVDVDADVALAVLGGEQRELGADAVGDVVVDLLAEEDDAVPQQPLEQLVPERHQRRLRRSLDRGRCRGPRGLSHACSPAPVTSGLIDWTITPPRNPIVPHSPLVRYWRTWLRPGRARQDAGRTLAVRARRHKAGRVRPWRPRPRPRSRRSRRSPSRPGPPPPDPRRRRPRRPRRVSGGC